MAKANAGYSVVLQFDKLPEGEEHLLVFGNEPLLFTAIRNIVVNACKYSGDHRALVELTIDHKMIIISVRDQGKGIASSELTTIFQPFYRVKEDIANDGFGLGLSLTDRIIKLHKGSITVSSTINSGTCFTVRLPGAGALH
jgi:signal transduction histidine kinase